MRERLAYPGYRWAYGSTKDWFRTPRGPYISVTYTPPDTEGTSLRSEEFHSTLDAARARCEASP